MEATDDLAKILKAFANLKHTWRTPKGIADEVSLSPDRVQAIFDSNKDKIIQSTIPRRDGAPLYTSLERLQQMIASQSKQPIKVVAEIAAEISEAEPGDIQKIGSLVIELLGEYNHEVLSQARVSFRWAVIAAIVGFVIFGAAIISMLAYGRPEISLIGVVGGAITEVVGGLQFYLYGRTMAQFAHFQRSLDTTQRFLIANSICESLDSETKQKSRSELVRLIALSAQTGTASSRDSMDLEN